MTYFRNWLASHFGPSLGQMLALRPTALSLRESGESFVLDPVMLCVAPSNPPNEGPKRGRGTINLIVIGVIGKHEHVLLELTVNLFRLLACAASSSAAAYLRFASSRMGAYGREAC